MSNDFLERTKYILDDINTLKDKTVIVFGLGGVGSFCAESLVRSGIGNITLVDYDVIDITNINRQAIATHSTVGKYKTEVAKERYLDINPKLNVNIITEKYLPENKEVFNLHKYDYIIDCIDMITAKIDLVLQADKLSIPIISSMGTGNKINPTMFEVNDIYKTSVCPLCRVMRTELKKRNIAKLKVIYSKETPLTTNHENKRVPGSTSFVPPVAGMIITSEVIKSLLNVSNL